MMLFLSAVLFSFTTLHVCIRSDAASWIIVISVPFLVEAHQTLSLNYSLCSLINEPSALREAAGSKDIMRLKTLFDLILSEGFWGRFLS